MSIASTPPLPGWDREQVANAFTIDTIGVRSMCVGF